MLTKRVPYISVLLLGMLVLGFALATPSGVPAADCRLDVNTTECPDLGSGGGAAPDPTTTPPDEGDAGGIERPPKDNTLDPIEVPNPNIGKCSELRQQYTIFSESPGFEDVAEEFLDEAEALGCSWATLLRLGTIRY